MKRPIQFVAFLAIMAGIVFLAVLFFRQNPEAIQVEFLRWRTQPVSKGFLVFLSFFIGVFVALFFALAGIFSKSMEVSRLRRENRALQKILEENTAKVQDHSSSSKK